MGTVDWVEIPRSRVANIWKLVLGVLLVGVAVLLAVDGLPRWEGVAIFAGIGVPLTVSNAWVIATNPPHLRANRAGVWFGGRTTVPWHEVQAIYDAGLPLDRYSGNGNDLRTSAIAFAFRRKRTLLRLPPRLWLTSMSFGDVRISTSAAAPPPAALVVALDRLRTLPDHEDAVAPDASEIPRARVIAS